MHCPSCAKIFSRFLAHLFLLSGLARILALGEKICGCVVQAQKDVAWRQAESAESISDGFDDVEGRKTRDAYPHKCADLEQGREQALDRDDGKQKAARSSDFVADPRSVSPAPPYSSSLCPSVRPSSLLSSSLSASVSLIPPAPSLHSSLHFTSSFPLSLFLPLVCFCACVRRYIDTQAWDVDWRGVRRDAVSPLGDLSNRRALEKKFHYQVCMIARCGAVSLQ